MSKSKKAHDDAYLLNVGNDVNSILMARFPHDMAEAIRCVAGVVAVYCAHIEDEAFEDVMCAIIDMRRICVDRDRKERKAAKGKH